MPYSNLILILILLLFTKSFSQNGIIGDDTFANGWTNADIIEFTQGAGQSRIVIINPDTGGNKFFRLVTRWVGNDNQWGPSSTTDDLEVTIASVIEDVVENSTDKAFEILNTNMAYNYVFKTRGAGNPPVNPEFVVFEIQGALRTINDVTQNIPASDVFFNEAVTITATLDGILNTGQGVYLRYTTDNFTNSTVVEMNGSGITYSADIPSNINEAESNVQYYVFTSGTDSSNNALAIDAEDADFYTINLDNNSDNNYSYTVRGEYITQSEATDWNNTNSWRVGEIPPNDADVIIAHDLNLTDNRTAQSIQINSGATLTNTGQTITIGNDGSISNNGSFIDSSGTVIFQGVGSVFGEVEFTDVEINGDTNFGAPSSGNQSTINGNLTLNSGSFVNTNSPIYGNNSTLIYNNTGFFNRSSEWSNTNPTQGNPVNVVVQNNTTLNMGSENPVNDAVLTGSMIIENNSTLEMNNSTQEMEGSLVVGGNFENSGTVNLSSNTGSDLKVEGDFTNTGIFNFNNRALFFEGNNVQNLNVTSLDAQFEIPFLVIDKMGGEVVLYKNITVRGNGNALDMKNNAILNLNGTNLVIGETGISTTVLFSSNSFLRSSTNSNLTLKGTQNFEDIPFEPSANILANIYLEKENNSSVGLANEVMLKEGITLKNGVLNSNGNLIFVSDANNTAIVRPEVDGTFNGTISGDVVVQRHFPLSGHQRSFRYISPSVTTSTSINANWQEGQSNPDVNTLYDNFTGFGTHITGNGGSTNGFDATQTNNYSLFTWNDVTQAWDPVTNTLNTDLDLGDTYALMVRGDRSAPLNSNTAEGPNPATLRTRGTLDLNDFIYNFSAPYNALDPNQFVLVGNPYQAQVNMIDVLDDVGTTGISPNYIWVWDPTLTDKGAYAVVDLSDIENPEDINGMPSSSQANQYLQPFQAVFVQVNAAPPQSVHFQKDDIDNSEPQTTVFSTTNASKVEIELHNSQNSLLLDAVRLQFDPPYSNTKTFEDAAKFWNNDEYLAIINGNSYLSIDKRNLPQNYDTISLLLGNYQTNQYELKLQSSLDDGVEAQLYDHYLDQAVDLQSGLNTYGFSIDTNVPESLDGQRFVLVFNPQTLGVNNQTTAESMRLYPNPTYGIVYLQAADHLMGTTAKLRCFDLMGREVLSTNLEHLESKNTLDLSALPSGLYMLQVNTAKKVMTFKVQVGL